MLATDAACGALVFVIYRSEIIARMDIFYPR